jgi:hypothetical protein
MTARPQLPYRSRRAASRSRRTVAAVGGPQPETAPTPAPPDPPVPEPVFVDPGEPSILGFPAEVADGAAPDEVADGAAPDEEDRPPVEATDADSGLYVLRSADPSAGSLLLVAGAAGGMSLFLPWLQHGEDLGLALVQRALESGGLDELARSGLLLPVGAVVGGGVLFLLGLLAFRPARSHRVIGVVALLVSLGVAAGIVVRVADVGWDELRTDPGILCAVVLAGAGVLGALKAMLTPPEVTTDPR